MKYIVMKRNVFANVYANIIYSRISSAAYVYVISTKAKSTANIFQAKIFQRSST